MSLKSSAGTRYVFVGGLHRSGTSLLYRSLGMNPEISIFHDTGVPEDEGMFLQPVYEPASKHGGPGRFGFDSRAHLTENSALANSESSRRIREAWGVYWDNGKRILAEKSPPNIIRTRFLQELFAEAYFIIVMRHPIATSYATKKWSGAGIHSLLRHWLRCHEIFDTDRRHLRNVLVVKYEKFVADPEEQMGRIWSFLEVGKIDQTASVESGLNDKYFEYWSKMHKERLTRVYVEGLIRLYGQRVARFGYSLRDLALTRDF